MFASRGGCKRVRCCAVRRVSVTPSKPFTLSDYRPQMLPERGRAPRKDGPRMLPARTRLVDIETSAFCLRERRRSPRHASSPYGSCGLLMADFGQQRWA